MLKRIVLAAVLALGMATACAAVNINTATEAELQSIKGIGPTKARDIVAYREKNGAFQSVDDLKKVKGIADKTLDKIRSEISVQNSNHKDRKAVTIVPNNMNSEKLPSKK